MDRRGAVIAADALLPDDLPVRGVVAMRHATVGDAVEMRLHVEQRGLGRRTLLLLPRDVGAGDISLASGAHRAEGRLLKSG